MDFRMALAMALVALWFKSIGVNMDNENDIWPSKIEIAEAFVILSGFMWISLEIFWVFLKLVARLVLFI